MSKGFLKAASEGNLARLQALVARGVDINFQDDEGNCALTNAVSGNYIDCVSYLLSLDNIRTDQEVDWDDNSEIMGTAMHIATANGYLNCIYLLFKKSPTDINFEVSQGYTPLHAAVIAQQVEAFELLLKLGANDECTTFEDEQGLGFLEGMNTLQLIAHFAATQTHGQYYLEMWRMLIRIKLKKGEPLRGNAIDDSNDTFSDTSVRETYYRNLFSNEEDDSIQEAMVQYYLEESDEFEPDEEDIEKIIRRSGRDDFRKTYNDEVERYKQKTNPKNVDAEDFSDTDSEADYDYSNEDADSIGKSLKLGDYKPGARLVLHARGHHFYKIKNATDKVATTHSSISEHKKYSKNNQLASWSLYSADTYSRAGLKFSLPLTENDNKLLNENAQKTKQILNGFGSEKNVIPVMQRAGTTSRDQFDSRLIELVQRYVNSYSTLLEDIKNAKNKSTENLKNERTQRKHELLEQLKSNPFLSTSEDIGMALQYAFASINYDKEKTHQARLDIVLSPEYQSDGDLRHPYIGVIFIVLHQESELKENSINTTELFSLNKIDTIKGPGTHETSGYVRALERIFMGEITSRHICLAKVVRLPNLFFPYRSFVLDKYGLNESAYNKYKQDLLKHGKLNTGEMRNKKEFYRTQQCIMENTINFQKKNLITQITNWASAQNITIGSLDDCGAFVNSIDINLQARISAAAARRKEEEKQQKEETTQIHKKFKLTK